MFLFTFSFDFFFFFKQKTAYEMRISDWSSDVCSSDLSADNGPLTDFLRAELLTAANSPRAEVADIMPILSRSPYLPQAAQLGRLATKRGATDLPTLPFEARLAWAGSAPRRLGADSVKIGRAHV